jgi:hypothetical protein
MKLRFPKKPVKKYKNLQEFRKSLVCWAALKEDHNFWPCGNCRGDGVIYDPNDPADPNEGNRHRNVLRCPLCQGSGKSSRKEVLNMYNDYLCKHFDNVDMWKRTCVLVSRLGEVLDTRLDFTLLGKYIGDSSFSKLPTIKRKAKIIR